MQKNMVRSASLAKVGVLAAALLTLAACNTVHGAGKDVSALGHDVSRGAAATQHSINKSTGASSQ